jgi:hypothetical protein
LKPLLQIENSIAPLRNAFLYTLQNLESKLSDIRINTVDPYLKPLLQIEKSIAPCALLFYSLKTLKVNFLMLGLTLLIPN